MSAVKCENLLFISYTPESTTVHKADFERDLWNDLFHLVTELLNESSRYPKEKHPAIKPLRKKLQLYQRDRISLLAEFPSTKAIPCVHQDLSGNTTYGNHGNMSPYSTQSISDMHEVARKVTDAEYRENFNVIFEYFIYVHLMKNYWHRIVKPLVKLKVFVSTVVYYQVNSVGVTETSIWF